jgi:hypothetical protein
VSCLAGCGDGAGLRRWVTWSPLVSDSTRLSAEQRNSCRSIEIFTPRPLAHATTTTGGDTQLDPRRAAGVQGNTTCYISYMTLPRRGETHRSMRSYCLGPI